MTGKNKDHNEPAADGEVCFCSFCGKGNYEVKRMVAGPTSFICDECIEKADEIVTEENKQELLANAQDTALSPREIKKLLDRDVIGQDSLKKKVAIAICDHFARIANNSGAHDVDIDKSNILVAGPTGTGKTEIGRTLAKILDVPFVTVDITKMTAAGYVGDDVQSICTKLFQEAGNNLERAQRGIVLIDEIDKIRRQADGATKDVGGEAVQQALLKMVEGDTFDIQTKPGKAGQAEMVPFDTSEVLFIGSGAFVGLEEIIRERLDKDKKGGIGFGAQVRGKDEDKRTRSELLDQVTTEDLQRFGMIPELLGRFPVVGHTNDLDTDTLTRILTEPRNSLVKQYTRMFEMKGADLVFEPEALRAIAEKASKMGRGARGLKSVMTTVMEDASYELPSDKINHVTIGAAVVNDNTAPVYAFKKRDAAARKEYPHMRLATPSVG